MTTRHIVTHVGSRPTTHLCRMTGCGRLAWTNRNGRWLCDEHAARGWQEVTAEHVRVARVMMLRSDWSLVSIAEELNVSRADLDAALWRHIAEPLGRRPRGDF